jgi:predicted ATP-grasp superfamily ATP-dependent carboligase
MAPPLRLSESNTWDTRFTDAAPSGTKVSAVILSADVAGLGMARSFGIAGVPVILVDLDSRLPGMHSRYVRSFLVKGTSGPALIDGLLALRTHLDHRPILFLRSDVQVHAVSQYRERLGDAFQIRLPEHRCLCELLHKGSFQRIAEKHGFAIPRAVSIREENDFSTLAQINFPAVVKLCDAESLFRTGARRPERVWSRDQAVAIFRAAPAEAPEFIVQEWVEGDESDIYFCLQYRGERGITVSSFTGRKLRCWPPHTGLTASCTAAPECADELELLTTQFFNKTQLVGMCSMEFKRDKRTGQFFMIEPTVGRTDWQEEVATLNGVNIPLAAYHYELGLPLPAIDRPRRPLIWTYTPSYWLSVFVSRSFHDSRPPGTRMKSACWRLEDPVPFALFCFEWIVMVVRKLTRTAIAAVGLIGSTGNRWFRQA